MPEEEQPSGSSGVDLFGLKPLAKSVEIVTQGVVDAASALLERICLPAAKEYGLLLKDKMRAWRNSNIAALAQKAEQKMIGTAIPEGFHAHPRIVNKILEEGSWIDDSSVQEMWAGLLASSCTAKGDDDSNLILSNLLGGLTGLQARIMNFCCEKCPKLAFGNLIHAVPFGITFDELCAICGEIDIQRLDRELDYLRSTMLLDPQRGGIALHDQKFVDLTPTSLALHMYVRCQGSREPPTEFFHAPPFPPNPQSQATTPAATQS